MKQRSEGPDQGFTLLELVLALALSLLVVYLLTTAIELFLVREDGNRVRTESAQAASAVLNQMTRDIRSLKSTAFEWAKAPANGSSSTPGGSTTSTGGAGGAPGAPPNASTTSGNATGVARSPLRLIGSDRELRLDCRAPLSWQRMVGDPGPGQSADPRNLPGTIRYFVSDGEILSSQRLAARGAQPETADDAIGLVREIIPAGAPIGSDDSSPNRRLSKDSTLEMLAPEVVEAAFSYFDGKKMVESWDSTQASGLPLGVEIRVKVLQTSYEQALDPDMRARYREGRYAERDVVEYRRFVSLRPSVRIRSVQPLMFPLGGNDASAKPPPGGKKPDENAPGADASGNEASGGAPSDAGANNG